MNLREQILAADDSKLLPLDIPEWNCKVWIRTISGIERDSFEAMVAGNKGKMDLTNVRARLAVLCVADESGKRLFEDKDAIALGSKSASALDAIFEAGMTHNKMHKADVDDLVKN